MEFLTSVKSNKKDTEGRISLPCKFIQCGYRVEISIYNDRLYRVVATWTDDALENKYMTFYNRKIFLKEVIRLIKLELKKHLSRFNQE